MKRLLTILGLTLAITTGYAQSNTTFYSSVSSYFTSYNTNFTYIDRFAIYTGAEQVQGNNTAAILGVSIDAYRFTSNTISVSSETLFKNSGVAGTLLGAQTGLGLNYTKFDTRVTLFAAPGYNNVVKGVYGEFGFKITKKATENTFYGIGMSLDVGKVHNSSPNLTVFTGFTF